MKRGIIIGVVSFAVIVGMILLLAFRTDPLANINADSIIEPSNETGFIAEKIVGDPERAKLIIYEYADFGCSHCADWNKTINELMESHSGEIALVFRTYNLGFVNGPAAARAATAAQIQGYFNEYKNLVFANQAEWLYENSSELSNLFLKYFEEVSSGSGDIDKFKDDMESDSVKTRLRFEQNMGKKVKLAGTPMFRIDGETINLSELEKTIERKLNEKSLR